MSNVANPHPRVVGHGKITPRHALFAFALFAFALVVLLVGPAQGAPPPKDTTPPETTIDSGPASPTPSTSATFTFSSNEAGSTFKCALDKAVLSACTSPRTYSKLAPGPHQFRVRATDKARNADPTAAEWTWTIGPQPPDTTPPETLIQTGPEAETTAKAPPPPLGER